ncbi:MAG: hypothetical protein B6I34_10345 [Anaerolineaceae bacterium 4572_32.1]|nr:MAG: hypothetical protein B6I34_10345 [Anaerolineaceae bacterium 4572_32.1]
MILCSFRLILERMSIFGQDRRISVLKRRHGPGRCLYHGEDGFERWVGWGVIAHNLLAIGTALTAR